MITLNTILGDLREERLNEVVETTTVAGGCNNSSRSRSSKSSKSSKSNSSKSNSSRSNDCCTCGNGNAYGQGR